ncbi:hypothetical protein DFJ73DRAFT_837228 [Zopfochytrium polystomum]|nr:hypothetical protein DFJ73DRAFT_837228 [Zopfochytrium polystomum]
MSAECRNCDILQGELDSARRDFDEFQADSKEYEAELDKEIQELKKKNQAIGRDMEDLRRKLVSVQTESNKTINSLQGELERIRHVEKHLRTSNRELEIANDSIEQNARIQSVSIQDLDLKYSTLMERMILMENDLDDKTRIEQELQRSRDEVRDLKIEVEVLKATNTKLSTALAQPSTPSSTLALDLSPSPPNTPNRLVPPSVPLPSVRSQSAPSLDPSPLPASISPVQQPLTVTVSPSRIKTMLPVSIRRAPLNQIEACSDLIMRAKALEQRIAAARDKYVQPLLISATACSPPPASPSSLARSSYSVSRIRANTASSAKRPSSVASSSPRSSFSASSVRSSSRLSTTTRE